MPYRFLTGDQDKTGDEEEIDGCIVNPPNDGHIQAHALPIRGARQKVAAFQRFRAIILCDKDLSNLL